MTDLDLMTDLDDAMRSLHETVEAIEETTGSGIPNSTVQKAPEIRVKGGLGRIEEISAANPASLQRNRKNSITMSALVKFSVGILLSLLALQFYQQK